VLPVKTGGRWRPECERGAIPSPTRPARPALRLSVGPRRARPPVATITRRASRPSPIGTAAMAWSRPTATRPSDRSSGHPSRTRRGAQAEGAGDRRSGPPHYGPAQGREGTLSTVHDTH